MTASHAETTAPALVLENLQVTVQTTGAVLLQPISLTLNAGQRLTLMGESGSGKSILAQAIMGTLPAGLQVSGKIFIAGQGVHGQRQATQPLWGKKVMMLPQEPWQSLNPLMRVLPQVAEAGFYARGKAWPVAFSQARNSLQGLGLEHASQLWPHQISGGMAQRVALATAEQTGAALMLADEPTKGLDADLRAAVGQLLIDQQGPGHTLLTITHDVALAQQLGGQLGVLFQGQMVEHGPAEVVITQPQHAYTQALVAAQPAHWPVLVRELVGSDAPVIQGTGLSKRYGARKLFEQADIALFAGEIVSIQGPSGCGKTTLGNMLLGLVRPDSGSVVRAASSRPGSHVKRAASAFQKLYQDPPAAFAASQSLRQSLIDVVQLHNLAFEAIAPLLARLNLPETLLERLPSEVSGGELQRVALLRLLLLKPAFIFADEPTSRLDPITQRYTMQLLCELASEHACAVLLVTHDPHIAAKSAHRLETIQFLS